MKIAVEKLVEKISSGTRMLLPSDLGRRAAMVACVAGLSLSALAPGMASAANADSATAKVVAADQVTKASLKQLASDLEQQIDKQFPDMAGRIGIYDFSLDSANNIERLTGRFGAENLDELTALIDEGYRENRGAEDKLRQSQDPVLGDHRMMSPVAPFTADNGENACIVFPSTKVFDEGVTNVQAAEYLVALAVGACAEDAFYEATIEREYAPYAKELKDLVSLSALTAADWRHSSGHTIDWEMKVAQYDLGNSNVSAQLDYSDAIAAHAAMNGYTGRTNPVAQSDFVSFDNIGDALNRGERTMEAVINATQDLPFKYQVAMEDVQGVIEAHFMSEGNQDMAGYAKYLSELSDVPKFANAKDSLDYMMSDKSNGMSFLFADRANDVGQESFAQSYAKLMSLQTDNPELDAEVKQTAQKYVDNFIMEELSRKFEVIDCYDAFRADAAEFYNKVSADPAFAAQVTDGSLTLASVVTVDHVNPEAEKYLENPENAQDSYEKLFPSECPSI